MSAENGILKGELKVKGGKLLKCSLTIKNRKISQIKITGDFFMYPEEKIEEMEKMLIGKEMERDAIKKALDKFFLEVETFGASKEDFLEVIMMAIKTIKTNS